MDQVPLTNQEYGNQEMSSLYQYVRENCGRVFGVLIICALWYMFVALPYHTIVKPSSPEYTAKKYVKYLKDKNYDKALECYFNIPEGPFTESNFIKHAMREAYEKYSSIEVKKVSQSKINGAYEGIIQTREQDETLEHTVLLCNIGTSMMGLRKDWKILFPFRTQDINIKGIEGTMVLIDNVEAGTIKGGEINIPGIIWGKRRFEAILGDIGKSDIIETVINDYTNSLELYAKPQYDFMREMDELVSNFSRGWSEYCLSQDGDKIKPYVTGRLFDEYTKNQDIFKDSKYVECQYNLEFLELSLTGPLSATYTVDTRWHLKEVITNKDMVFKDNSREELEQDQYIRCKYYIINDGGKWKIDSLEQLSFSQDIKK